MTGLNEQEEGWLNVYLLGLRRRQRLSVYLLGRRVCNVLSLLRSTKSVLGVLILDGPI